MLLCDAHTHFFSRAFFQLLAKQAAAASGEDDAKLLESIPKRSGIELPDPAANEHARRWLLGMAD